MVFGFQIELIRIPKLLQAGVARETIAREFKRALNEASILIRRRMITASPFGGTGLLREAWQTIAAREIGTFLFEATVVTIGSWAALVIERGAKPHFPPVGPPGTTPALGTWIRRKLGLTDPAKIRRAAISIGRKFKSQPRKPQRTFSKTLVAATPIVRRAMVRAQQRLARIVG